MKHLIYSLILVVLVTACQKDDDQMVAICEIPTQISVTNITNSSVEISWRTNTSAISFELEYGTQGFQIGTGNITSSSTNSYTLNGLQANTTYDVLIFSNCGEGNLSMVSDRVSFTTKYDPVATDFMPRLSQMNIYSGVLSNLHPSPLTFLYNLNTPLFTDYAHKQRLIALPENTSMAFLDNMLPDFPDDTVIAKTFYYNADERDESLGKTIIETRILIKKNGEWQVGNYVWNTEQSDAVLDGNGSTVGMSWVDNNGISQSTNYKIPTNQDCITCHQNNTVIYPIGPKLRSMNFMINGVNQLQEFINNGHLSGAPNLNSIASLPNWENTSASLEERARAYLDVNCAHCHQPGGSYDLEYFAVINLGYETSLEDSNIYIRRNNILSRMENFQDGYSMPYIGTSMSHPEGFALIQAFIDTL